MSELSLSQDVIYLRGEVSVKTVTGLSKQLHRLMQRQVRILDCSGVTRVDSSGAALLLVAFKLARATGANLTMTGLPEAMSRLLKLYDLESVMLSLTQVNPGKN